MTVSVQTPFTAAEANGSTTVFPYQFKINDADDLEVTLDGVIQTTGFTVDGVGDNLGGNVTFSVAPTAGVAVLLARNPILDRDTDYAQFGKLPSAVLDADFDRIWLALQKFANDFKRSLKLPVATLADQLIDYTPGQRASSLVSFDSNGDLDITPLSTLAITVSAGSFTTDTFSGTGAQTSFILSRAPGIKGNTYVFVGGAYLRKDQYEISSTTITFDVAPASGTNNIEVCQSVALEAGSPADNTVSTASLQAGALAATAAGLAKMANGYFTATADARAKFADGFLTVAKIADIGTTTGKIPLVGTESATTTVAGLVIKSTPAQNAAGTGTGVVASADLPTAVAALSPREVKAWINFDGTSGAIGTGRASYNVSSVTDNGTGDYTINFASAMADANYASVISAGQSTNSLFISIGTPLDIAPSTTALRFTTGNTSSGAAVDPKYLSVAIFR